MGWIIVTSLTKIINIPPNLSSYGHELLSTWCSKNLHFEMTRMESPFFVCSVELLQKHWQMPASFPVIFLIISVLVKLSAHSWWISSSDFHTPRQYSALGGPPLALTLHLTSKLCPSSTSMLLLEWMIGQLWVDTIKMIQQINKDYLKQLTVVLV